MTQERISSDTNVREQLHAIAGQLGAIQNLIVDLRRTREKLDVASGEVQARILQIDGQVESTRDLRAAVERELEIQRVHVQELDGERTRLLREIDSAASARIALEQVAATLTTRVDGAIGEQYATLRRQIEETLGQQRKSLDDRLDQFAGWTRTQLDDVIRAYQLGAQRAQETEKAAGERMAAAERVTSQLSGRIAATEEQLVAVGERLREETAARAADLVDAVAYRRRFQRQVKALAVLVGVALLLATFAFVRTVASR